MLEYSAEDHHLIVLVEDEPHAIDLDTLVMLQSLLQLLLAGLDGLEEL